MSETRREEIFEAFERLAARQGLDKVTMQGLAQEAGVSVGTIYLYFENKDALVLSVEEKWSRHARQLNAMILGSDRSPEGKIRAIIVDHVVKFSQMMRENKTAFELLMGAMRLRYIGRTVKDTRQEVFNIMIAGTVTAIQEGVSSGDFEADDARRTGRLFVQAFESFLSPADVIEVPHKDIVRNADAMFELLMRSIRVR